MPRLPVDRRSYCHHKGTDQAMVYVNGKQKYLGKWRSPEVEGSLQGSSWPSGPTRRTSRRVPAADLVPVRGSARADDRGSSRPVQGPCRAVLPEPGDRQPRGSLRPLREKFGYLPMADFGPLQLRVLRNQWIEQGPCPEHHQRAGDPAQEVL